MGQAPRTQFQSQTPYHTFHSQTPRKKSAGVSVLVIVACLAAATVGLMGIGAAAWVVNAWMPTNPYTPAVQDALTLAQLQELADSDARGDIELKVPASVDGAVILLAARDRNDQRLFDLQQRIATEYLYGSEVDEAKRDQVSQAIVTTYALNHLDSQQSRDFVEGVSPLGHVGSPSSAICKADG